MFKKLKNYVEKKHNNNTTQTTIKKDPTFIRDDFFFENGKNTPFMKVRINDHGILTFDTMIQKYRREYPGSTNLDARAEFYVKLEAAIEDARKHLEADYDPAAVLEWMGGSIQNAYNTPGTIESRYKHTIQDVFNTLLPTIYTDGQGGMDTDN